MSKAAGRPKNTDGKDIVDLDECLLRVERELGEKTWSRRTLQNKISAGLFSRFGTYHHPQVDWAEVRKALHWKRNKKVS